MPPRTATPTCTAPAAPPEQARQAWPRASSSPTSTATCGKLRRTSACIASSTQAPDSSTPLASTPPTAEARAARASTATAAVTGTDVATASATAPGTAEARGLTAPARRGIAGAAAGPPPRAASSLFPVLTEGRGYDSPQHRAELPSDPVRQVRRRLDRLPGDRRRTDRRGPRARLRHPP